MGYGGLPGGAMGPKKGTLMGPNSGRLHSSSRCNNNKNSFSGISEMVGLAFNRSNGPEGTRCASDRHWIASRPPHAVPHYALSA